MCSRTLQLWPDRIAVSYDEDEENAIAFGSFNYWNIANRTAC